MENPPGTLERVRRFVQKELSAWVDWKWRNENCLDGMAYMPFPIVDSSGYIRGTTMRNIYFSFSLSGDDLELSVYHPRKGKEPAIDIFVNDNWTTRTARHRNDALRNAIVILEVGLGMRDAADYENVVWRAA
jgi:hypothetical protein